MPEGVHVLPPLLSPRLCRELMSLPVISHHDDGEGHNVHAKTLNLATTARLVWSEVKQLVLAKHVPVAVDAMMKLYRLPEGDGDVAPHTDDDFAGPGGSDALYSIILYLDSDYDGGETVFEGSIVAPAHEAGGGLLFRHDILHEGRPVTRGVKHVLKTDLFVK